MTGWVIGSVAAAFHGIDFGREPKDLDMFADWGDARDSGLEIFWDERLRPFTGYGWRYATVDELYTIKISHSFWDLHGTWTKHIEDARVLRDNGAKLLPELYKTLYEIWTEKHGRKRVDLNMDKTEFFDDGVKRVYDHDSIHYSVAYGDRPMYESVLKAPPSVAIDMAKVWAMPFEDQVRLFREEVYATALERRVVPSEYRCSPRAAYAWALKRTVTSLTKGRSALFIAENYARFREPDIDYVARHRSRSHLLEKL